MTTDLIFHIGFPKCASTTLQNQILKNEQGYLGTYQGLKWQDNFAKQFQALSPVGPRLGGDITQARRWTQQVLKFQKEKCIGVERLILSSELLTNCNKIKDRPIIRFLQKFSDEVWAGGVVKVVLVLRNPAERLASGYTQISVSNPHASQQNFEKYITLKLKQENMMHYDKWVGELHQALGKENVCVLLMEEIGTLSFWQRLKDFCSLEMLDPEEWLKNMPSKNSNKRDKATWQLKPFDPVYKAKTLSNNIFGLIWPPFVAGKLRPKVYQPFKNLSASYYRRRFSQTEGKERAIIQLTPLLREKIQTAYSHQTDNLSRLLHENMKSMGY